MSTIKSKGTLLKLTIASTLTSVAQLLSLELPQWKSKGYENPTLDQSGAGVPRELTGYVDGGSFKASLVWDPELASHAALLALAITPAKGVWQVLFVNSGASTIDFTSAEFEAGPKVDMAKSLTCDIGGSLDGLGVLTV